MTKSGRGSFGLSQRLRQGVLTPWPRAAITRSIRAIWGGTTPTRRCSPSRRARRSNSRRRIPPAASLTPRSHRGRYRQARLRQGQSGLRAGLHRRRHAGRCDQGDAARFHAVSGWGWTANIPGFGLLADQFKEPALHIWKYNTDEPGAGRLRSRRARAAEALLRHHRPGAGGSWPALRRAAAARGRQHGYPRHDGGHRALSAGRGGGRRCSPSAIPMPRKATARSAARRSKAR